MKIKQILVALIFIGAQLALAEIATDNTLDIENLMINITGDAAGAESTAERQNQNALEHATGKDTADGRKTLPATINDVASGLQSKLDRRMEMDFKYQNTMYSAFAIAY